MTAVLSPVASPVPPVDRLVAAARHRVPGSARVAVWGVKGGVGTTTVSLLCGLTLARHRADPVLVADETLYGSLAVRAGLVLPDQPVQRAATGEWPGIAIGVSEPLSQALTVFDAPTPDRSADVEVLVVAATVDAVLMADGHVAPLVVLTQQTPRNGVDLDAAARRLNRDGRTTVATLLYDAHLAVGGPIAWERLLPRTRDACRQLAAAVITAVREPSLEPTELE